MFIKILNLEQGHISHIATNEGRGDIMGLIKSCIKILMMCTLIALTGYNAAFLCHHNYILSLSDPCLGVEKKIFKEIMHFHNMTYMATP